MDATLVQFGSVFRHREKDYVFLSQTENVLYAALILDDGSTQKLQSMSDRVETAARASFKKTSGVYSFVVLQTEDFKNRAAWFAKPDNSDHQILKVEVIGSLMKEDRESIKKEICSSDSTLPLKLIELVKDLNIV